MEVTRTPWSPQEDAQNTYRSKDTTGTMEDMESRGHGERRKTWRVEDTECRHKESKGGHGEQRRTDSAEKDMESKGEWGKQSRGKEEFTFRELLLPRQYVG